MLLSLYTVAEQTDLDTHLDTHVHHLQTLFILT